MQRIAILAIFCIFMLSSIGVAHAGWVDDWVDQKAETSPSYFQGQKRGFFTGGSFSARWQNSNDYLMTVSPPSIKSGCGGIDVNMGGFSFLNFEYLVQKLQRILQSAPAAAFDLALNELCEPCAKTIKSLEALADYLNSIQLDDCKASTAMVAKLMDPFTNNSEIQAAADADFVQSQGIDDLWHRLTDHWKSTEGETKASHEQKTDECPESIKAVFDKQGSTVLAEIGKKMGYSEGFVELARGYVGDVAPYKVTVGGTTMMRPVPLPPCDQSKTIDAFMTGKSEIQVLSYQDAEPTGICLQNPDRNANLIRWSNQMLVRVKNKMESGQFLSAAEDQFIDKLHAPVYSSLKVAIVSDQGTSIMAALGDVSARAYAYAMMSDMYEMVMQAVYEAEAFSANARKDKPKCQAELYDPIIEATLELGDRIYNHMRGIRQDYMRVSNEINTIYELGSKFEHFHNQASGQLTRIFSPAVAQRVMGNN